MNTLQTWSAWTTQHQPFELQWWKDALKNGHSSDPGFAEQWAAAKEFIKPSGSIIDIGCGPRPPFAPCTVIEPLANAYKELTPPEWWDGVVVYTLPAETLIPSLHSSADTAVLWNAIDHAIGWRVILYNVSLYLKPGGRLAIATDFQDPFLGHPGVPKDDFLAYIDQWFEVIDRREPFGRHLAMLLRVKP